MTLARSLAWIFALVVSLLPLFSPRSVRAEAPAPPDFRSRASTTAPDAFIDLRGGVLGAESAYERLHRPPKPQHLIALGEELVFLGVGTTWYWAAKNKNIVDWDNPSAKARFTLGVIRMDNNTFPINFTLHPWSGAAYYSAARMSNVSLGWSAAYAVGATLLWEYGIEFHEKVSFNDLIVTPLGGITLGEFFSRLALYVNRYPGKPTLGKRFAGTLLGTMQAFTDLLSGQSKQVETAADNLGLSAAIHHAFRLHVGLALQSTATRDSLLADLGVDAQLISLPSYQRPGRFRRLLRDGDFTRFWMTHVQGSGEREFDSYADLSLFGWYAQQISPDMRGGLFFLGSSMGYRYRRSLFKGFRDEISATHLPGIAFESALYFGPQLALRVSYRLHADFAGVHSLSYPVWQAARPDAQGKTVTEKYGYWYGFGLTSLLEASLSWSLLQLGGRAWFGIYNSTEGLDRAQEELTADPRGYDRLLDTESYLRLALGSSGLQLELNLLMRRHLSRLGGYQAEAQLLRPSVRLGFAF